jgi:membrane-bound inhibitor of C-type lysozyme
MNELYTKVEHFESKKIKEILEKNYKCETKKLTGTTIFSENFTGYIHFVKKGQMLIFSESKSINENSEVMF